ncbi:MAG: hypothetical protein PUK48_06860 [Spirochaetales bacterium]|nr:hypothetical protein [Spirochaetales bacterium]
MNIFENFLCELQWTDDYARTQVNDDEDAYDEESESELDYEIGESRYEADLDSWDDMPKNFEPVDESQREEYYDYLERKENEDY